MSKSLFRDSALKKISAPENLEKTLAIIKPKAVYWIVAISVLLLGAIIWGFYGTIPETVEGIGILRSKEGVKLVKIPYNGTVNSVEIEVGDTISQGDLLMSIDQYELKFEIKNIEQTLEELQRKYDRLNVYSRESSRSQKLKEYYSEKSNLSDSLSVLEKQLKERKKDFLLTSNILILNERIEELNWLIVECENFTSIQLIQIHDEIVKFQNLLNQKNSEYRTKTRLFSPYDGIVIEVTLGEGDVFDASHRAVTIENINSDPNDLTAIVFVDAQFSKRIEEGMDVLIDLSTVSREEFGYLKAKVLEVGKYPSSKEGLFKILSNEELINRLTQSTLPVYVQLALQKDNNNYSGFQWTSGKGPKMEIIGGTLIDAKIILDEKIPIELIIPSITH